jgi:hypothetical protein
VLCHRISGAANTRQHKPFILFSWAWSFAGDEFGELLDVSCGALHACTIFGRFFQEGRKGDDPEGDDCHFTLDASFDCSTFTHHRQQFSRS